MFIDKIGELEDKPIIGMLHLAGKYPVEQAINELRVFEKEGLAGAIVGDYHGSKDAVIATLERISKEGTDILLGLNVLSDPYSSFELAHRFGASFVQWDSVQANHLDLERYGGLREEYPGIAVFGGVRFKYKSSGDNPLEVDIEEAKSRCEVIVTTGEGTGIETPIEKLREFKRMAGDYPVFPGAGVNKENAYEQMSVVDGVIVGTYLKEGNTRDRPRKRNMRRLLRSTSDLRD